MRFEDYESYQEYLNKIFDEKFWIISKNKNIKNSYYEYLTKFPNGTYREKATKKIDNFLSIEKDEKDWHIAKKLNSIGRYNLYLSLHPNGLYSDKAKKLIKILEDTISRKLEEDEYWNEVCKEDTSQSYDRYLSKYKWGRYRKEAEELKEMMENEITIEGLECRIFVFKVEVEEWHTTLDGEPYLSDEVKYGLMNHKKEILLEAKYSSPFKIQKIEENNLPNKKIFYLINGYSFAPEIGIIDTKGKVFLEPIYKYLIFHNNGIIIVSQEDNKYGMINANFDIILSPIYEYICSNFYGGVTIIEKYNYYGLVSDKGEILLPIEYDFISEKEIRQGSSPYYENCYLYRKNKKYGLFNHKKRKQVLSSLEFEKIIMIKDYKIFLLYDNGKFGFANIDGEITIMPELIIYEEHYGDSTYNKNYIDYIMYSSLFKETFLKVKKDDKYGVVSNKGEYILFPEYKKISIYNKEIFSVHKDNYDENGLAIYHNGKINVAFSKKVKMESFRRVSKNIVEFDNGAFGAGLVTNDGKILLESNNPFTFSKKKAKIIEQYG